MFETIKKSAQLVSTLTDQERSSVLQLLAQNIRHNSDKILLANKKDLEQMSKEDPKYGRLILTQSSIESIAQDVEKIANMVSPLGKILGQTLRPNGLEIKKICVPLGVVAVIYESRPNVTIDVFALCFKTSNVCVLKGGKEADHSNKILAHIIHETLKENNISENAMTFMPSNRESTEQILNAVGQIDVCIPRGSHELIKFVRTHSKIPVIETGAGIVHIYFDEYGDTEKGKKIIFNAKTRKVSVCNALDTLLIHESRLRDLSYLLGDFSSKNVFIYADPKTYEVMKDFYPKHILAQASENDFGTEFLDYKMSLKSVSSLAQAMDHIQKYSSAHSEAIITEDLKKAEVFLNQVDAAAVYLNASTSFSDGGEFGMGAEIGISTQKLHARGPMGLDALTSYKWIIYGNGQIR